MDSENIQRKKKRSLLTFLRESCIYSEPINVTSSIGNFQITPHKVTELKPRDLELEREFSFSIINNNKNLDIKNLNEISLLIDLKSDFFRMKVSKITTLNEMTFNGTLVLDEAIKGNKRGKERKTEPLSCFVLVMLHTKESNLYPISGYARLVNSDEKSLCVNLHFFQDLKKEIFIESELHFLESPLGIFNRKQKISHIRNYVTYQQVDTTITKVDAILMVENQNQPLIQETASLVMKNSFNTEFQCLLHDSKKISGKITSLLKNGFILEIQDHTFNSLPTKFQLDHCETKIRMNALKYNESLFVMYTGISLGTKTIWFNYLTKYALEYDHCFTSKDTKRITRLMLESGNYSSHAMLHLSLMNDYFQNKWPIEENYSSTKYRWLVRDKNGEYIGHTSGVRVSESLWAAIDNIGSQSYTGSWNSDFVCRWIRSFIDLLTGIDQKSWVQWTFTPDAGIWTNFDNKIKNNSNLVKARDRFWGVFLLNRKKKNITKRNLFSSQKISFNEMKNIISLSNLKESQKSLLDVLNHGLNENSSFQIEFEKEYGFKLERHYFIIKSNNYGRFLLTYTNYPSWATLHKGHDWDYLFPIDQDFEKIAIDHEDELLDIIEELIFESGCVPYRLAIVSPNATLSIGRECINLILSPMGLEFAAKTLEKE